MLVTNGAAGVVQKYAYDAYGNNYEGSFAGSNNIGYNGKRYDGGTGWYDYGFRDYDSRTGRFTTVDPIRDGMNWYAYCGGDPINFLDPNGYNPIAIGIGIGGIIIVGAEVIVITSNKEYQETVKKMSANVTTVISSVKTLYYTAKYLPVIVTTAVLSKGKKVRDGEGNPIPLGNQKQSPLGKGANAGPEDIGDLGDLGGDGFKPPEDPNTVEKAIITAAAITSVIDNTKIPKSNDIPKNNNTDKDNTESVIKNANIQDEESLTKESENIIINANIQKEDIFKQDYENMKGVKGK